MIRTNEENLLKVQVTGEIAHSEILSERGYVTTWDGRPKLGTGVGGIKYNVKVGDSCFGWAGADHLEPGVSIHLKEGSPGEKGALNHLACIGNEVIVKKDDERFTGTVTGKHGYKFPAMHRHHVLIHFSDEDLEKLMIEDKALVKAYGIGLQIEGFEDLRITSCSPRLLGAWGIEEKDGKLAVPVAKSVPAYMMGSGAGGRPSEKGNWDIQTSYMDAVEELGLEDLRIGDLVACIDILTAYGYGYYKGAVTVGVISYGASDLAGHGPGVTPLLASREGAIEPKIDGKANIANYLKLREV